MAKVISELNKLKAFADENEEKKKAKEEAIRILNENEPNGQTEPETPVENSGEYKTGSNIIEASSSIKYPEEMGINPNSNNIFAELEKVDKYFATQKDGTQTSLGLETLEMPDASYEEIRRNAQEKLGGKYNNLKNSTEKEYSKRIDAKQEEVGARQSASERDAEKINSIYDNASTSAENQALRRGLARSSIIINQLDGIEKERAKELTDLATGLSENISRIDSEIDSLNRAKENALEALDLDYASEVEAEIQKQLNALESKKKEVAEFNNKVKQLEAEYALEKREKDQKNLESNLKLNSNYGYVPEQENLQQEYKVKLVLDYLGTLSKNQAISALKSDTTYAYYLGDAWGDVYYYTLSRSNNA